MCRTGINKFICGKYCLSSTMIIELKNFNSNLYGSNDLKGQTKRNLESNTAIYIFYIMKGQYTAYIFFFFF